MKRTNGQDILLCIFLSSDNRLTTVKRAQLCMHLSSLSECSSRFSDQGDVKDLVILTDCITFAHTLAGLIDNVPELEQTVI